MRTHVQITEVLGVRKRRDQPPAAGPWLRESFWDWGPLGYPGVYSIVFYPTDRGIQRWRTEQSLWFPDTCCACSRSSTQGVDFHPYHRFLGLTLRSRRAAARAIPHCDRHASVGPCAFVEAYNEHERFLALRVFGCHRPFLEACLELNSNDDSREPPWVVFPNAAPQVGWSQGTNEHWMRLAWAPFWHTLDCDERARYLDHWEAPDEWQRWLLQSSGPGA